MRETIQESLIEEEREEERETKLSNEELLLTVLSFFFAFRFLNYFGEKSRIGRFSNGF